LKRTGEVDGAVLKAMDLLEPQPPAVEQAGKYATAGSPEVDGQIDLLRHDETFH